MKKLFTLIILISSGMMNSSCEREEICAAIHLADLISFELAFALPSVETGTALILTTAIKNVAESTRFCETSAAGNSNTGYTFDFRADEDSPWESGQFVNQSGALEFELLVPTSSISPNDIIEIEPKFAMDEPGQYRFGVSIDASNDVSERDEENNNGQSGEGTVGKSSPTSVTAYTIITVLPSEDYISSSTKKGKIMKIRYLGITEH